MPSKEDRYSKRMHKLCRRDGPYGCDGCYCCAGNTVARWSKREALIIDEPVPRPGEAATALESAYEAWLDNDLELIVDDAGSPADLWERAFIRDAPPVPPFTLADAI